MKANRNTRMRRNERAEVGIGTLIVFIAAVLVAAVAAAVLINTSGQLQERGAQTGKEATEQVSSNLALVSVWASRTSATSEVMNLNITIETAPGSVNIDMNRTLVIIADNATLKNLTHQDANPPANNRFNVTALRDLDGSFSLANPKSFVMTSGDVATLWINLAAVPGGNGMSLNVSESMTIEIIPPTGAKLRADVTMPSSFGRELILQVR